MQYLMLKLLRRVITFKLIKVNILILWKCWNFLTRLKKELQTLIFTSQDGKLISVIDDLQNSNVTSPKKKNNNKKKIKYLFVWLLLFRNGI